MVELNIIWASFTPSLLMIYSSHLLQAMQGTTLNEHTKQSTAFITSQQFQFLKMLAMLPSVAGGEMVRREN